MYSSLIQQSSILDFFFLSSREEKAPPKDLVKLFIRAHASRAGVTNTAPWVVEERLVKKYALPSKFADFLLSPSKVRNVQNL